MHRRMRMLSILAGLALAGLLGPSHRAFAAPGDILWLGNDNGSNVFATGTNGDVLTTISGVPTSGIAFDGHVLYFSEGSGTITVRSRDGSTVLGSFTIASPTANTAEDLAWDVAQQRLWRINHDTPSLQKINPNTGTVEATFFLPTTDPGFTSGLGGLGVAYDQRRNVLYVSYAERSFTPAHGLVQIVDPRTGAVLGELFRTTGFFTAGLAYDVESDTLWVGDQFVVRNMTRAGVVLSMFGTTVFADGLEFIHHPVPGVP